jgi:hypothetical protein
LVLISCNVHLFVSDDRYVKVEDEYILFYENIKESEDIDALHKTVNLECVDTSRINKVSSLFVKEKINPLIAKNKFINLLKTKKNILELGNFYDRGNCLQFCDTIYCDKTNLYLILPVRLSYTSRFRKKLKYTVSLNIDNEEIKLNVTSLSLAITALDPLSPKLLFLFIEFEVHILSA